MFLGKIVVQCLPPISTSGLRAADVNDLVDSVYQDMNKTFTEISKTLPVSQQFNKVIAGLES